MIPFFTLGFRFSGWQKQLNAKTVHDIVDKSLSFVFEDSAYKTIGVGRTDAKVSANAYYFQLFRDSEIEEVSFLASLNSNFPPDFRAITVQEVGTDYNVIQASKSKEYHYYFSFGAKNHPFAAPFLVNVAADLDLKKMMDAARLFEGEHYFHKYCTEPTKETVFKREIISCVIEENDILIGRINQKECFSIKIK